MVPVNFEWDDATNYLLCCDPSEPVVSHVDVLKAYILPILRSQSCLINFKESFNLWINKITHSLLMFCIEFVPNHECDKDPENSSIEIVSKSHGSACNISVLCFLFWQGKANLLLTTFCSYFLRWQSQYTFLFPITCFSIPVKLPAPHDNPSLMHISGEIASLLFDITVENSPSKFFKIMLL